MLCFNTKLLYDSRRLMVVDCLNKMRVAEPECVNKVPSYLKVYGRRNTSYARAPESGTEDAARDKFI